jgi:hypothetical protein
MPQIRADYRALLLTWMDRMHRIRAESPVSIHKIARDYLSGDRNE